MHFTDGGATWYEQAQTLAVASGISDGSMPQGNVTREQLIVILYRYHGSPNTNHDIGKFKDADKVSNWAADVMQWVVQNGLLIGSNNSLNPQGDATRTELAVN